MYFETIALKDMSWNILKFLYNKPPMKASEIAEQLNIKVRQCDASITKALVRWGFVIRSAHLTRFMKKEYNLISITPRGVQYVEWRNSIES